MTRPLIAAAVAFALLPTQVGAIKPPIVARDESATMQQLAAGVYAIIHDDATDYWPHGNTGVIVTDDGILVIDSTYLPSRAKKDIALIRSVTKKPVRFLTTTHWHFDHNNGAIAYREAFPNITVIGERQSDAYIAINSAYWPKVSRAEGSARLEELADLENELASGKSAEGENIPEERRRMLRKAIPQRKAELKELATLEVVRADAVFDRSMALQLGGKTIELVDRGRANSPNDMTVYLPGEQILFAGDIIVQSPLPYTGGSWPRDWVQVLSDLEATPTKVLVPGHGPVMDNHAYTKKLRETFEAILFRVEILVREGKTLDQTQDLIELDDLRAGYPLWNEGVSEEDWAFTKKTLVERAYKGVRGQG